MQKKHAHASAQAQVDTFTTRAKILRSDHRTKVFPLDHPDPALPSTRSTRGARAGQALDAVRKAEEAAHKEAAEEQKKVTEARKMAHDTVETAKIANAKQLQAFKDELNAKSQATQAPSRNLAHAAAALTHPPRPLCPGHYFGRDRKSQRGFAEESRCNQGDTLATYHTRRPILPSPLL